MERLLVLCLLTIGLSGYRADGEGNLLCVQQGFLLLNAPVSPEAANENWPLCHEYQSCSCCNISHVRTIHQSIAQSVTLLDPCKRALADAACRVCHPEVGIGILETVCTKQCDDWHKACQDDYFAFDYISSTLMPCNSNAQLICSQLKHLVMDGKGFCDQMGIKVSQSVDEDCWYTGRPVEASYCQPKSTLPLFTISDFKYPILLAGLLLFVWILPYCGF